MSELIFPAKLKEAVMGSAKNIIIASGRDSGKTHNSTAICGLIAAQYPNVDGIACRASYGSIADSLYSEMEKAISSIPAFEGVFRFMKSPLRMSRPDGGGTIYFKGIGGSNFSRTKGISPKNPIGFLLMDELQELKTKRSLDEAIASFRRWYGPNVKAFYLFNPPSMEAHWINLWCAEKEKDPDYLVVHMSWEDISMFLTDYDIREILKVKRDDFDYYDWFYMGNPSGGFGSVYPMLRKEIHVITPLELDSILKSLRITALIIGGDGAVTHDCTAFSAGLVLENGQCVMLTPFVHDPKIDGVVGYHTLVKDHVVRWFWDIVAKYNLGRKRGQPISPFFREVPCFMHVDQAAPDLVQECRFFLSDRIEVNPTSKGTVMEMVATVQSALSNRMLYILNEGKRRDWEQEKDIVEDNAAYRQLSLLTWNEKQTGYDPSVPNDVADSATYMVRLWYSNGENMAFTESGEGKMAISGIIGRGNK